MDTDSSMGLSNGTGNGHDRSAETNTRQLRREMADAVGSAREHVAQDIQTLVNAASSLGRAELSGAKERFGKYVSQLSDAACDLTAKGKEQCQAAVATTETYVKANPWQSLAICAAAAFLLGRLTARR